MAVTICSMPVPARSLTYKMCIRDRYNVGLRWGELNPDETIPTFIAELEASGINTIIEECQTQLDAYLASK